MGSHIHSLVGRGSSVSITIGYVLDGQGIESPWRRDFRTCPDLPWGPRSLLYNGYRVFPGGKERPGRDANPSPPSSAVVMKGYSYTTTRLRAVRLVQSLSACTRVTFNFYLYPYTFIRSVYNFYQPLDVLLPVLSCVEILYYEAEN